ncbi:MAG TPA: hypothetical protein VKG26_02510 [Bacteroidia bacterium]|nr:hypothetical protein [Bacteroidia bacterium]
MRKIKPFVYLLLILVIVFQSCSIEKRLYTTGYSVQWKKNNSYSDEVLTQTKQPKKKKEAAIKFDEPVSSIKNVDALTASIENKKDIIVFTPDSTGCDTLVMRNDTEIKVKVIEITPTEVKYKYCDNITGPTYVSYRYEVSYIKYANGMLDSFKNEFAPSKSVQQNNQPNNNKSTNTNSYETWVQGKISKMSLISVICGVIALVPFVGIPGIFMSISAGAKALRLIKKNPEFAMYKNRAWTGIGLALLSAFIYIIILGYLILKSGILGFVI